MVIVLAIGLLAVAVIHLAVLAANHNPEPPTSGSNEQPIQPTRKNRR